MGRFNLEIALSQTAFFPRTISPAHFQQKWSGSFVPENAQIQTSIASSGKSELDFPDDAIAHFQQKWSGGFVLENAQANRLLHGIP